MLWGIVEKITGVNRRHLQDMIRETAINYVESRLCKCGHIKWAHKEQGNGSCANCDTCPAFASKDKGG